VTEPIYYRKLTRAEATVNGCEYCADYKRKGAARWCDHDCCPYDEIAAKGSYSAYLKKYRSGTGLYANYKRKKKEMVETT